MTIALDAGHHPFREGSPSELQGGSPHCYGVQFLTKGSRVYAGKTIVASSDWEAVEKAGALYADGKIGALYEVWHDTVLVHAEAAPRPPARPLVDMRQDRDRERMKFFLQIGSLMALARVFSGQRGAHTGNALAAG